MTKSVTINANGFKLTWWQIGVLCLGSLIFLLPSMSQAEQPTATFAQWLDKLVTQQPEFNELQAMEALGQAHQQQAKRWLPQGGSWQLVHENDAMTGSEGLQSWELGVELPLWAMGEKSAQQAIANSYQLSQNVALTLLKLELAGQLRQVGWQWRQATVSREMAERELAVWQALSQAVEQAVKSGERPVLEGRLAQQAVLQAQQALTLSQFAEQQAQQQLALLGVNGRIDPLEESVSQGDWLQHPLLQWQTQQVALAENLQKMALAQLSGSPSLTLAAKQQQTHQAQANSSLLVGVSVPFGQGNQLALAQADQQLVAQKVALAKSRRQLHQAWLLAHNAYQQSQQQSRLLNQLVAISRESLKMAQRAYQTGETPLSELLRVQQQALSAERDAALGDMKLQQQIALLNQALGVLPE